MQSGERFSGRVRTRDDAARLAGAPVVAALPARAAELDEHQAYRTVRMWLVRNGVAGPVAVLSLGTPGASRRAAEGLAAAARALGETADVIPADAAQASRAADADDSIASPQFAAALARSAARGVVVLDGGEAGEHEPAVLTHVPDCVLVVRSGGTRKITLARARTMLDRAGARCRAVILIDASGRDETLGRGPGTPKKPEAAAAGAKSRRTRVSAPAPLRHDRAPLDLPPLSGGFDRLD